MNNSSHYRKVEAIYQSDLPDMEKLIQAFDEVTRLYVEEYSREAEVLQAMGDEENLIKERIKLGVMQSARHMFNHCHLKITGKAAWHDTVQS